MIIQNYNARGSDVSTLKLLQNAASRIFLLRRVFLRMRVKGISLKTVNVFHGSRSAGECFNVAILAQGKTRCGSSVPSRGICEVPLRPGPDRRSRGRAGAFCSRPTLATAAQKAVLCEDRIALSSPRSFRRRPRGGRPRTWQRRSASSSSWPRRFPSSRS